MQGIHARRAVAKSFVNTTEQYTKRAG